MTETATAFESNAGDQATIMPAWMSDVVRGYGQEMEDVGWLDGRLGVASPDLLRARVVKQFAEALMAAEVDAACGAGSRERTAERQHTYALLVVPPNQVRAPCDLRR